jgi:hypothetical protein
MKSVEQWCFSIGKNDEGLLATVFQQQWCFIGKNDEKLLIMVFQQQKGKGETIAGRSCFVDENGEEMADWSVLGVGRMKSVEQWCFSIGKNDEGLLATVFQQREKNEKLLVMVFQQQKGKGETIAGRSCFVDENGEEMADWRLPSG